MYAFIEILQLPENQFLFPKRGVYSVSDPVLTPELFRYFFAEKTKAFEEMSAEQLAVLHAIYKDFPEFKKVLPERPAELRLTKTRSMRFHVSCPAVINVIGKQTLLDAQVLQVSEAGMMARIQGPLAIGARITAQIRINQIEVAEVSAVVIWSKGGELYGFRLDHSVPAWEKLINHLKSAQNRAVA